MSNRLFIGLLAAGLGLALSAACHPTGSGQTGTAGNGSTGAAGAGTGNSSGSAGSGSGVAGTTGSGGSTGAGNDTGSGGSTTGAAGADPAGSAGASGAAGSTGAGNSTGSGGAVTIADMIDNLDDADGRIMMANGRQGPWHSFNDSNGGNQQPPIGQGFLPVSGGANNTSHGVHTTGSGYQFGGVGFDLNNSTMIPESMQSQAYNASAYNGITFWAKGSGMLRIEFPTRSFVPTDRGGSCTSNCWNVYGANTPALTSTWTQITIPFSSLQREQGGTTPPFNASEVMGVAFKGGGTFDFWIDEVAFTRTGGTGTGGSTGAGGSAGTTGRGGTTGAAGTTGLAGRGGSAGTGQAGTTAGRGGTTGSAGTTGSGGSGNVVHPPPITSGGSNGWGSRYWDCCKPSCGWRANAGNRTPAKSCGQQNMSVGENEQSACSGGGAFMCWNEAPWPLDDTLAYGFAAHNGVPCGRCYQLQFTGSSHNGDQASTGPLNGKTMIVQVTNIGGIGSDQFDLLIPGGGVGAADPDASVCKSQFGNVDLGAQNGGLRTACNGDKNCVRTRCMSAFNGKPDMLAGCNWFVDWFNAADNPNFVFKQIGCPSELVQRSGLSDPG